MFRCRTVLLLWSRKAGLILPAPTISRSTLRHELTSTVSVHLIDVGGKAGRGHEVHPDPILTLITLNSEEPARHSDYARPTQRGRRHDNRVTSDEAWRVTRWRAKYVGGGNTYP